MSYLIGPRLHFTGKFQADVSTVNNTPSNFDIAMTGPPPPGQDGFNPDGTGQWGLSNCAVTGAVFADGRQATTTAADPIVGQQLGSLSGIPPKLVDLDPDQQGVSQIWGLIVGVGPTNAPLLTGAFEVAPFSEMWTRPVSGGGGDSVYSGVYQSVLSGVAWGDLASSPFLQALQAATAAGLLSIRFVVDGYQDDSSASDFTFGRITGTIGIAVASEPKRFVVGRQCAGLAQTVNFFAAKLDEARGKLVVDFGNAFQTATAGGDLSVPPDLRLGVQKTDGTIAEFGPVNPGPQWYAQNAGIWEAPAARSLSAAELTALGQGPLVLYQGDPSQAQMLASEDPRGVYVRSDEMVFRMSPGDTAQVTLTVSVFGRPAAGKTVEFAASVIPPPGSNASPPAIGLDVPASAISDANGNVTITMTAKSPGAQARPHIDGQVYQVNYRLAGPTHPDDYSNPWNFISVLVWSDFRPPASPTWWRDIHPILKQYADLYPYMANIVDLGDYASVVAMKDGIASVFRLPVDDPGYMPVTRDLSPRKRQMLLDWLGSANPPEGTPPAGRPAAKIGKHNFFRGRGIAQVD
ncbi:MAG TPA: Ig-like domain-containing protein [Caulobacteraceae bacterium]|jgi:hypothetical protein